MAMYKAWSKEEIEFLTLNYTKLGYRECSKLLKRSENSILSKHRKIRRKEERKSYVLSGRNKIEYKRCMICQDKMRMRKVYKMFMRDNAKIADIPLRLPHFAVKEPNLVRICTECQKRLHLI